MVTTQLEHLAPKAREQGYAPNTSLFSQGSLIGLLNGEGMVALEVDLRAGKEYLVVGSCDGDCDDLDLLVRDARDETLDDDMLDDDTPVLIFTANNSGPHTLIISMASCSTNSCYFGVRFFEK